MFIVPCVWLLRFILKVWYLKMVAELSAGGSRIGSSNLEISVMAWLHAIAYLLYFGHIPLPFIL